MANNTVLENKAGKYVEISALTYTGPVPKPHPPCTDPTPDEQYRRYKEQKSHELQEREQKQQLEGERASMDARVSHNSANLLSNVATNVRNFASKVALKVERAGTEVTSATESKVRQLGRHISTDRFASSFPELAAMGEVLLADYPCAVMHAKQKLKGNVYITKNYLCFSARFLSGFVQATSAVLREVGFSSSDQSPIGVCQVIPLTDIASIVLSVTLETLDQGPPFFMPLPAPEVVPSSLQIYTKKRQLFQFFDFEYTNATAGGVFGETGKGRPIDHVYNYLDHVWRASVEVPLSDVNYAS